SAYLDSDVLQLDLRLILLLEVRLIVEEIGKEGRFNGEESSRDVHHPLANLHCDRTRSFLREVVFSHFLDPVHCIHSDVSLEENLVVFDESLRSVDQVRQHGEVFLSVGAVTLLVLCLVLILHGRIRIRPV
ncbi:hypothetical protein PMAYCL1PPCAC_26594, partial [Pristionchus mayeri]